MATIHWRRNWESEAYTRMDQDSFWANVGIYSPLIVKTQDELDYLVGMQMMIGKDYIVLLDGRDENPCDLPPSYVEVHGL